MNFKKVTLKGDEIGERSQFGISSHSSKIYIFGGQKYGETYNDLFQIDTENFNVKKLEVKGNVPSPRWKVSMTTVGDQLFVFGGETVGGNRSNELHIFDLNSQSWSRGKESGVTTSARSGHTATLIGDKFVIYGGEGGHESSPPSALMVLDLPSMEWSVPDQGGTIPEVRTAHSAITFNGKLVVYGGMGTGTHQALDEVWVCDFAGKRWFEMPRRGVVPEPRTGAQAWMSSGKYFCVFGGKGPAKVDWNELHYCDITAPPLNWQKKKQMGTNLAERFYHGLTPFNESTAFVFGGQFDNKTFTNEAFTINTSSFY
eukprot:TRINITY_DN2099_c0_g1_i1.p1 TRINITY_DN2099_c0_g1~~TRINITY_DN2099_c0_g1_i1.p1  ORF type:complete len:314 (-),score=112.87 TRINITY_DN2099_c0_g1_i1:82-1023(-)